MKILFIPTLGKGLGHIKRTLLIATQLFRIDKKIEITVLIDNKILQLFDLTKFNTIILPSRCNDIFQEIVNTTFITNNSQYQKLVLSFIDNTKPDIVIYDFIISEPIIQLVESYGGKNVLILREQKEKYLNYLISSGILSSFDKILIPHDFEEFNLKIYTQIPNIVNVGPIFDRNINYNSNKVRLKFNIKKNDIWIITSCGGGGFYKEPEQMLEILKNTNYYFKNKKNLKFSYFKGIYTINNITQLDSSSLTIHDFDINLSSYFYSADIIVSLLGYNSFYEILNSGKPAILIPAKRTLDDQNKRFKGKKLPENLRICTENNDAKKHLIELIEQYNIKKKLNSDSMLFGEDGALVAAKEILSIPIIKNISIPSDSTLLSGNELKNLKETFINNFRKGITNFYFKCPDLSNDILQNISNFYNETCELNLNYNFHLVENLKSVQQENNYCQNLKHVNLRITQKCNSKCIFCYHWQYSDLYSDMPLIKIIDIANQAKSLGAKSIVVNGGEPTLHRDFFQILKVLNELKYTITVNTNGSKFQNAKFINNLSNFPMLNLMITVLSIHDVGLRGVTDWSSKTIGQIKALKREKAPFKIRTNIVLNKKNFNQLNLMLEKLLDANVDQITINLIDSVLNIDSSTLYLSEIQIKELYFKILPLLMLKANYKKINVKINPLFLRICYNYAIKNRTQISKQLFDLFYYQKNFNLEIKNYSSGLYGKYFYDHVKYCSIPHQHIYIMSNGDVYPCLKAIGSTQITPFGNLYYRKMNAIIHSRRWKNFAVYAGNQELCEMCNNAFLHNFKNFNQNV